MCCFEIENHSKFFVFTKRMFFFLNVLLCRCGSNRTHWVGLRMQRTICYYRFVLFSVFFPSLHRNGIGVAVSTDTFHSFVKEFIWKCYARETRRKHVFMFRRICNGIHAFNISFSALKFLCFFFSFLFQFFRLQVSCIVECCGM